MKNKNRGSAIIEITLLIPIFLFCIYFFILFFLFLVGSGEKMDFLCRELYQAEAAESHYDGGAGCDIKKEGTTIKASYQEQGKWFDYDIILQRDGNNPAKNIRRWQLATEQF